MSILIDGQFTEELDYGSMLPRLLYGKLGATLPANLEYDPYDIPGFSRSRDGIKKMFGAMLFGKGLGKWTKYPEGISELVHQDELKPVQVVIKAIREAHFPVSQHFGTRIGHQLQFIESEILIDVLLDLKRQGIVALPIHDAVLVAKQEAESAKEAMLRVFKVHAAIEGKVKVG